MSITPFSTKAFNHLIYLNYYFFATKRHPLHKNSTHYIWIFNNRSYIFIPLSLDKTFWYTSFRIFPQKFTTSLIYCFPSTSFFFSSALNDFIFPTHPSLLVFIKFCHGKGFYWCQQICHKMMSYTQPSDVW